jgi:tellurite methyltransferase
MLKDQERWDEKYRERVFLPGKKPNAFLQKHIHRLPRGKALDLACGDGANAVFLAQEGFTVEAVDISPVGLKMARKLAREKKAQVHFRQVDLDSISLPRQHYDLIVVLFFLSRRLIPRIRKALKPGGMIVFETYTAEQRDLGTGGPHQVSYLLKPNELLRLFSGLHVVFYREGVFPVEGRRKAVASLIAAKKG